MSLNSVLHRLASIPATAFGRQRFPKRRAPARTRRRAYPPLFLETLEERVLLSTSDNLALMLLDPTKTSLSISGKGTVQAPGGTAVVDSKSAAAVIANGNGYLNAGELDIVGVPGIAVSGKGKIVATADAKSASLVSGTRTIRFSEALSTLPHGKRTDSFSASALRSSTSAWNMTAIIAVGVSAARQFSATSCA